MADIFISYKSERRAVAKHLASVLENYGYSVWFDHKLVNGTNYALQIDQEIRAANAVVVLWCSMSVSSDAVLGEYVLAQHLGKLVSTKIQPCDVNVLYHLDQYEDFIRWNQAPDAPEVTRLLGHLTKLIGRPPVSIPARNARLFVERGRSLAILGKHRQAVAMFGKAIALIGNDPETYCDRGDSFTAHANDSAIADYQRALMLDPNSNRARSGIVWWKRYDYIHGDRL